MNNENISPQVKLEKTNFGRVRVLTAPPTSVHELVGSGETASSNDGHNPHQPQRRSASNTSCSGAGGRRSNLRPSSGSGSTQRLSSGGGSGGGGGGGSAVISSSGTNRDHSVTQFALIDDENVSALQQITRGGGALTLASQWKSQFDDSEETTDNEWKQEPQSPDHHNRDKSPLGNINVQPTSVCILPAPSAIAPVAYTSMSTNLPAPAQDSSNVTAITNRKKSELKKKK